MSRAFVTARLVPAFVFIVMTLCSASSFAITTSCPDDDAYPLNGCSLPGLVDGSYPFFYQAVKVRYVHSRHKDKFRVKAHFLGGSPSSYLYVDPTDVLAISGTRLKFKANVVDGIARGSIKISGKIDELGVAGTLMTAELEGSWGADGTLIGFNTSNIQCNPAIDTYLGGAGCTINEVIYLNMIDAIGPDADARKIKTTGIAMVSIPLPTSAWLFVCGLIGLAGCVRRPAH